MKKNLLKIKYKARALVREYFYNGFYTATPATIKGLRRAFKKVSVDGDYYEFGLYKGFTFYKAHVYAGENRDKMNFFGFDSFEGLPPVDQEGIDGGKIFFSGQYSCSIQDVEKNLNSKGINVEGNTILIKGFYSDILNNDVALKAYDFKPASIVLIDCDLYESTKDVLNFMRNKLQVGTIILFDDWNCFGASDNKGERKAFQEFLSKNRSFEIKNIGYFGWHGAMFIVNKI